MNWLHKKTIDFHYVNYLVEKSLKLNQMTNYGPNVKLLEEKIRYYFEIDENKSIIVVNNGSIAIQILALGIELYQKKKINWATQSFTFPPSAQSNLKDVKIVDINLDGGIKLDEIDENVDGIIITNIFGNIVDIDKYINFCKDKNIYLIFDNAATSFTFYKKKKLFKLWCRIKYKFSSY